jgi:hypothetical protein
VTENKKDTYHGLVKRLRRAIQRHGIIGLLRVAEERITRFVSRLRPSVRTEIKEREQRAAEFDHQFGVDTAGCIHPTELNINSPNQLHAVSYRGSDPRDFRNAIGALPINFREFVFIDFGSGKGRAILLASEFPFQKIIGVEFSEELDSIAQENIKRFHSDISKCTHIESICIDVVDYKLPDDNLVCYFCNPFDAALMAQVLTNIRESFLRIPRDIFIVYYNAKAAHLLSKDDRFRETGTFGAIRVWRTVLECQVGKE